MNKPLNTSVVSITTCAEKIRKRIQNGYPDTGNNITPIIEEKIHDSIFGPKNIIPLKITSSSNSPSTNGPAEIYQWPYHTNAIDKLVDEIPPCENPSSTKSVVEYIEKFLPSFLKKSAGHAAMKIKSELSKYDGLQKFFTNGSTLTTLGDKTSMKKAVSLSQKLMVLGLLSSISVAMTSNNAEAFDRRSMWTGVAVGVGSALLGGQILQNPQVGQFVEPRRQQPYVDPYYRDQRRYTSQPILPSQRFILGAKAVLASYYNSVHEADMAYDRANSLGIQCLRRGGFNCNQTLPFVNLDFSNNHYSVVIDGHLIISENNGSTRINQDGYREAIYQAQQVQEEESYSRRRFR